MKFESECNQGPMIILEDISKVKTISKQHILTDENVEEQFLNYFFKKLHEKYTKITKPLKQIKHFWVQNEKYKCKLRKD